MHAIKSLFICVWAICISFSVNCLVVSSPWSFCWLSVFILLIKGSLFLKEVSPVSGPSRVCAISLLSASIIGASCLVRWGTARPNHTHWSPYQLHGSPAPCAHLPCTCLPTKASPSFHSILFWTRMARLSPSTQSHLFAFRSAASFTPHYFFLLFYLLLFFWLCQATCGILAPPPGIKPMLLSLEAWSLNHWTAREVPPHKFW